MAHALADTFHPNEFMAKCGGITNAELNKLEVDLCERMWWGLTVEPEELITMTQQLGDASSPLWSHWGTDSEVCEQGWLRGTKAAAELDRGGETGGRVSPCGDNSGRASPPSTQALFNAGAPQHQRSLSLDRMLGRKEQAQAAVDRLSPEASASPRSVLSRTLSFGWRLPRLLHLSALVNL